MDGPAALGITAVAMAWTHGTRPGPQPVVAIWEVFPAAVLQSCVVSSSRASSWTISGGWFGIFGGDPKCWPAFRDVYMTPPCKEKLEPGSDLGRSVKQTG